MMTDISTLYSIFEKHRSVTTDSRQCRQGDIFFALKGDNFDGNRYAKTALDAGCAYAVIDDAAVADPDDSRYIVVDNVLLALQQLARHHRRTLATPVVGITGSNGKTTTKELTAAVLQSKYRVLYTEGNLNNSIGVPLTLLRLTADHDIAIVEMGASHPGDIKELVEISEPDCGIITNVGRAHMLGFGSFEGVVNTKGELYDFLSTKQGGVVFVDADNKWLTDKASAAGLPTERYAVDSQARTDCVTGQVTCCDPMLSFVWREPLKDEGNVEEMAVKTQLIGTYNLPNMLAAITIGLHFGVGKKEICHALEQYVPRNNRSQLMETALNHLVVDAYNANPTSMKAALENFKQMAVPAKMAILGQMNELGEVSQTEHQALVDRAAEAGLDEVWLVGNEFKKVKTAFPIFENVDEVIASLSSDMPQGRYILIKGSNSIRLSKLTSYL